MVIQIKKQESQFSLLQKLTLFLLVLAGMNFISRDRMIGFVACAIFLAFKARFVVDKDFLTLTLFSLSWTIFAPSGNSSVLEMIKPFVFPLAYCAGLNFLPVDNQDRAEKNFRITTIVLSAGPFIHFFLNFLYNFGKDVERSSNDFWSGDVLAATAQASLALMMLAVAIVVLFTNTRTRNKVLCVAVLVAIFLYNLTLAGRTLFVIMLIIFGVSLLFLVLKGDRNNKKYKTLLVITLVILVLMALYNANVFNIQETVESSNFYNRFFGMDSIELNEDSRMERKSFYFENFGKYLWGGAHLRASYGYAHDILLDTYDEAGLLTLIAMLAFLISAIVQLVRCITRNALKFETQQWVLGMYVAIIVQFMVEPVIQGIPWMFMLFCFIHGMVTRLNKISTNLA